MAAGPTPSQTIGPFFHVAMPLPGEDVLVGDDAAGAIPLTGLVVDGAGQPVDDALVEIWQASASGRYDDPGFLGFGRAATDAEGRYRFVTMKPGLVGGEGGVGYAPHINVSVFARGLLHRLVTRIYFADEEEANATDPVLSSLAGDELRRTLVARPCDGGFRFDIRLQGDGETVFFAI